MNTMMEEGARQASQHMMGNAMGAMGSVGQMLAHPAASSAMMAAGGYAAGKGLLGAGTSFLRNPLIVLAAGVAAGYLIFKYEKEIVATAGKLTGMGKDFVLHQKENLDDLIAETKEGQAGAAVPAAAPASALAPAQE